MRTRQDYITKKCTHREYYGQAVTEGTKRLVKDFIGEKAIKASTDEHFNDIDLSKWDRLHGLLQSSYRIISVANGSNGYSLSDTVCIAKEAARQIKEEA